MNLSAQGVAGIGKTATISITDKSGSLNADSDQIPADDIVLPSAQALAEPVEDAPLLANDPVPDLSPEGIARLVQGLTATGASLREAYASIAKSAKLEDLMESCMAQGKGNPLSEDAIRALGGLCGAFVDLQDFRGCVFGRRLSMQYGLNPVSVAYSMAKNYGPDPKRKENELFTTAMIYMGVEVNPSSSPWCRMDGDDLLLSSSNGTGIPELPPGAIVVDFLKINRFRGGSIDSSIIAKSVEVAGCPSIKINDMKSCEVLIVKAVEDLTIANLSYVEDLNVEVVKKLVLPELGSLGGDFRCSSLQECSVPKLASILGVVTMDSAEKINFENLVHVEGRITAKSCSHLSFPLIDAIDGDLNLEGSTSIAFPVLEQIRGSLLALHASSVDLPKLEKIRDGIYGWSEPSLKIPALKSVAGLDWA